MKTLAMTMSTLLVGSTAFASGWECAEVKDKAKEYSQGGSYLVALNYEVGKPGVPALLIVSDGLRAKGDQVVITRKGADIQHKSAPQQHWPKTQIEQNTTYTSRAQTPEDKIDEIVLLSFVVNANPSIEKLREGDQRAGLFEVPFRGGRVRRDLECRYKPK